MLAGIKNHDPFLSLPTTKPLSDSRFEFGWTSVQRWSDKLARSGRFATWRSSTCSRSCGSCARGSAAKSSGSPCCRFSKKPYRISLSWTTSAARSLKWNGERRRVVTMVWICTLLCSRGCPWLPSLASLGLNIPPMKVRFILCVYNCRMWGVFVDNWQQVLLWCQGEWALLGLMTCISRTLYVCCLFSFQFLLVISYILVILIHLGSFEWWGTAENVTREINAILLIRRPHWLVKLTYLMLEGC